LACLITALSVVLPARIPARPLSGANLKPHTTGREVGIRLGDLVPKGQEKDVKVSRDGTVESLRKETLAPTVTCPSMPFTAMALVWDQNGKGEVSAQVESGQDQAHLDMPGQVSDESQDGPDPGSPEDHPDRRGSSLLWVGSARCSKLTVTLPAGVRVKNLRAVFVNSAGKSEADVEASAPATGSALGFGATAADAATAEPAIITRQQWGADEKLRNCGPYYAGPVKMAFVHHTAGPNDYSRSQSDDMVRAIYWYHTNGLGWCDIAYNSLVDKFGRVFEGRYGGMDLPVLPGATKGFNTGSFAVSAMGTFSTVTPPSAMVASIERVLAWRLDVAHVPPIGKVWMYSRGSTGGKYPEGKWVLFNRISGHRDAGFTSCPGDRLYAQLASIRTVAYNTGLPKIFLPRRSTDSIVAGTDEVTWTASASTWLWWRVQVTDQSGQVIRSFKQHGEALSVSWTGLDTVGQPVPVGSYTMTMFAGRNGRSALPASLSLAVVPEPTPSPSPSPSPSDSPSPSPSP